MPRCDGLQHEDAAQLVRTGHWAEANPLLEAISSALDDDDLPDGFTTFLRPRNDRKRAQSLQLRGELTRATEVLEALPFDEKSFDDAANALADLGLIRGGFRSLPAVLPTGTREEAYERAASLRRGEVEFLEPSSGSAKARPMPHLPSVSLTSFQKSRRLRGPWIIWNER